MKHIVTILKAVADPNRLRIIKLLEHGERCVCEIHAALGMTQPNISKHVRVLKEAGLIEDRKDGMWTRYSLKPQMKCGTDIVRQIRAWLNDDPAVVRDAKRADAARREKRVCEKWRGK